MKGCANYLKFRYYYNKEQLRLLHVIFCKNKWLDMVCALRWADKAAQKYIERYNEILKCGYDYKKILCLFDFVFTNIRLQPLF